MIFLRRLFAWIAAVLVGIIVLYKIAYPTYEHRYRLTVEVNTPDGLKSGSSVISSALELRPKILPHTGAKRHLLGEAVMVDLGGDDMLFALLKMDPERNEKGSVFETLALSAFNITRPGGPAPWKALTTMTGMRDLSRLQIPMLVRFRNIGDPKTVERVDPDDLARSFGDGVSLKRVTLEMVSSGFWPLNRVGLSGVPFTTGHLVETLPWLLEKRRGSISGQRKFDAKRPGPENYLTKGAFFRS